LEDDVDFFLCGEDLRFEGCLPGEGEPGEETAAE